MRRRRPALLMLALCCITGCHAAPRLHSALAPDEAFAVIAEDSAWFVFPKEADTLLSWNIAGSRQFQGAPQRIWTVRIGYYAANEILELTVRQDWTGGARAPVASLGDIVNHASVFAGRAMYDCVCVSPERDPAIQAQVVDRRIRIVVHGKAAMARWLSHLQDTVQFTRLEADTSELHAVRTVSSQAAVVRWVSR